MSWNGTVRCGSCHENGHNKTGCPELRKAWEKDPDSYKGRQWATILARKARPKVCGYCDEEGHTRAGCDTMKAHKSLFQEDLILWRMALVKWMKDTGLGVGALVKCDDASYYRGDAYMYPGEENYIAPVGMIMHPPNGEYLTHYAGIPNTAQWNTAHSLFQFERIGAGIEEQTYRKTVGLILPCIAGIVPRLGTGYYQRPVDRQDRLNNVDWEVVSPAQGEFTNGKLVLLKELKKATKIHFAAPQEEKEGGFHTFDTFQRKQLQRYVNGEIELSQMKDPELPQTDS